VDAHEAPTPGQSPNPDTPAKVPRRYVGASTTAAPSPGSERSYKPDRAWDKALLVLGAVVVVVALLIVPGILNRGGQNPIAAAAEATRNSPGVRMSFNMSTQGPVPMTMTGTGVMNGETHRASMEFTAQGGSAGTFSMTEVVDDLDLYMRSPLLTAQLGSTKSWLLIRAESFLGDLGGSGGLGAGMSASPSQELDALQSASDHVTTVGPEQVGGVETTHYTAAIDVQKLTDELRSHSSQLADLIEQSTGGGDLTETVDVWIDAQGLIRRAQSSMTMGSLGSFTMTIDFSDYGIHPKIDVPPQSQVYDATPILERILSGSASPAT
jgi:hypothetical protein